MGPQIAFLDKRDDGLTVLKTAGSYKFHISLFHILAESLNVSILLNCHDRDILISELT